MAFAEIEGATGLALKMVKCVLVCLGSISIDELREFVAHVIPSFAEFAIAGAGLYLGALLGPMAEDGRWLGACTAYRGMVRRVREQDLGLART